MSLEIIKKLERSGYTTMALSEVVSDELSPLKTRIPILNFAVSGDFNGGLPSGTTIFAGPSSSFKTALLLLYIKAFQKEFPSGVVFFLDTESGSNYNMMKNFKIDLERVIYLRPKNMHELHHELQTIVEEKVTADMDIMIAVDSIGNVATASEIERAKKDKITTDMGGRAKEIKAMFRTTSPFIQEKGIYAIFLNHTYDTPEMFSERLMSGGSGPRYDAQNIIFLNKVKLPKELVVDKGDNRFNILVNKSRRLIDGAKFHIDVYQKRSVDPLSYLDDLAKEIKIDFEGKETPVLSHYHGQFWDYLDFDSLTGEVKSVRITKSDLQSKAFWAKALTNPLIRKGAEDLYVINVDDAIFEDDEDIFSLMEDIDKVIHGGDENGEVVEVVEDAPKSKKGKKAKSEEPII